MKSDKDKWIAGVLGSLEGGKRAVPPTELFARSQQKIAKPEAKIVPIGSYRFAAAAAVLLLVLNVFVLHQYSKAPGSYTNEQVTVSSESLISDFNLYGQ